MPITPLMPVYPRCGFRPVRGDHCHLIGDDGGRYLDFAAGIAVNLLGHSHAGLIGAIQRQAATLMHVSNLYGSPQGESLAQRLVDLTFADTVFFTNSGAEAMECAIKTARAYHQHVGNDQRLQPGKDAQGLYAAVARFQICRVRRSRCGAGRDWT